MNNIVKWSLKLGVCLAIAWAPCISAGVAVVVHPSNKAASLSTDEIERIFLGKTTTFASGDQAIPIDQPVGSASRDEFYTKVLGKNESQLKAYWSRIIFTGKGQPPREEANDGAVKKLVAANPNLVGYIDTKDVDGSVKVLFQSQ